MKITDKNLRRGKQLYQVLLRYEGLEAALLYYLKKYREEDNQEYTFHDLLVYIESYKNSEFFEKEEVDECKNIRTLSEAILLNRGKEICDALMANKFNLSSLEPLARQYAKEDNRDMVYSNSTLYLMRKYYLANASLDYIKNFEIARQLAQRSRADGLDFTTLKAIIEFNNPKESYDYMNDHNISYDAFKALRNAYFRIYPNDTLTRNKVDNIEDTIIEEEKRLVSEKIKERKEKTRLATINEVINNYANLGRDDLDFCLREAGIVWKTFAENIRIFKQSNDPELKEVYQKYLDTEKTFYEERKKLVETLVDYYQNGVNYGSETRPLSLYDYLMLTNKTPDQIKRFIWDYISISLGNKICIVLNKLYTTKRFKDRTSFIEQIKELYPKISDSDIKTIANYIESQNWPLSVTLFKDIYARLSDGLIVIPSLNDKNITNLHK